MNLPSSRKSPREAGSSPLSSLPSSASAVSFVSSPISVGISPVKPLSLSCKEADER